MSPRLGPGSSLSRVRVLGGEEVERVLEDVAFDLPKLAEKLKLYPAAIMQEFEGTLPMLVH
jgi:hypothetical protein